MVDPLILGALRDRGSWFLLKEYQKDRIRTLPRPQSRRPRRRVPGPAGADRDRVGRDPGKGCKKGTQSRLGFLPVRHTDFIFAALAEEWGFLGVAAVLGLYGVFPRPRFRLARDARDRGGACSRSS